MLIISVFDKLKKEKSMIINRAKVGRFVEKKNRKIFYGL